MKKNLLKLILAGTFLGLASNSFSQNIKIINPSQVQGIDIKESSKTYKERLDEINFVKYLDYKEMMSVVKDVRDAEIYCTKIVKNVGMDIDSILYGERDYWASFKQSYEIKKGDCDDGVIAVGALLYDNGFHPYFLTLNGKQSGHIVFLYKNKKGKFGTIGINNVDCKRPKFKDIEYLIKEFKKDYPNQEILEYYILDAQGIFPDAIDKPGNYKRVDESERNK
jgi:hypothetical protein